MPDALTRIYIHFVWATWDRRQSLTEPILEQLYACIVHEARTLDAQVLALGSYLDHIHLLAKLSPAYAISDVIKQIKGSSSHHISHTVYGAEAFKWQGSYGAFSVSHNELRRIREYIDMQRQHHENGSYLEEWEQTMLIRDHAHE